MDFGLLSFLIWLPLIGALALALPIFKAKESNCESQSGTVGAHGPASFFDEAKIARMFAFLVSAADLLAALALWMGFKSNSAEFQFREHLAWIPSFGISYDLGVDGISLLLVMLTTFLVPIVVIASAPVKRSPRAYLASMLLLECAMLGTLLALDGFLFYIFWELMLAPMYFIIGIWGGERRVYATMKFVLYTVVGSVLMLVALIFVALQFAAQQGELSFYIPDLIQYTNLSLQQELWVFGAFALAFGIKVPIFPFHTWLPDAHVEAPTGGSVILAGVLLKMGVYGFLRLGYPLCPRAAHECTPLLAALAVIGIVYGALVAWSQRDIKKLVAYSSVSHLGFCILGLAALSTLSVSGCIYQMINHGVSTGALFLLVGVLYERRHTREISEYGGLASRLPLFAFFFLIFTLSSIAVPLTNGFVGEFMILTGSFTDLPLHTLIALLAVILGAVYMLTLYLQTMFGEIDSAKNGSLADLNGRELVSFAPLLVLVFVMGVYSRPFTKPIEASVSAFVSQVEERAQTLNENEFGYSYDRGESSGGDSVGVESARGSSRETESRTKASKLLRANLRSGHDLKKVRGQNV